MKRKHMVLAVAGVLILVAGASAALLIRHSKGKMSKEEQELFGLVNKARERESQWPIKAHPGLVTVARAHALRMARQQQLHFPDSAELERQLHAVGYSFDCWGMTIDAVRDIGLKDAFDNLMKVAETRAEVLNANYEEVGVAVVPGEVPGLWYVAQVFARRKR